MPVEAVTHYGDPLRVTRGDLLREKRFAMKALPTREALFADFAEDFAALVAEGRRTKVALPVGSIDYRVAAGLINRRRIDCRNLVVFGLDEFCDDRGLTVGPDHPLSCRGRLDRSFYQALSADLRPARENIIFPEGANPGSIGSRITDEGGIDVCYGDFGIDGSFALNVPPSDDAPHDGTWFELPARVVSISPQMQTLMALEYTGGDLAALPPKAVTLGMSEVMKAATMRVYLTHGWQSAVIRRALYGPVTPLCPASLLQRHPEMRFVVLDSVADQPIVGTATR